VTTDLHYFPTRRSSDLIYVRLLKYNNVMKKSLIAFVLALSVASCSKKSNDNIPIQGKVERDELAIVGKIAGRIDKILVQEGDFVKKGDTLAILDIPELVAKK